MAAVAFSGTFPVAVDVFPAAVGAARSAAVPAVPGAVFFGGNFPAVAGAGAFCF